MLRNDLVEFSTARKFGLCLPVAKFLKSNQNKHLEELEEILRRPVLVKADPLLHHEKFDLG